MYYVVRLFLKFLPSPLPISATIHQYQQAFCGIFQCRLVAVLDFSNSVTFHPLSTYYLVFIVLGGFNEGTHLWQEVFELHPLRFLRYAVPLYQSWALLLSNISHKVLNQHIFTGWSTISGHKWRSILWNKRSFHVSSFASYLSDFSLLL